MSGRRGSPFFCPPSASLPLSSEEDEDEEDEEDDPEEHEDEEEEDPEPDREEEEDEEEEEEEDRDEELEDEPSESESEPEARRAAADVLLRSFFFDFFCLRPAGLGVRGLVRAATMRFSLSPAPTPPCPTSAFASTPSARSRPVPGVGGPVRGAAETHLSAPDGTAVDPASSSTSKPISGSSFTDDAPSSGLWGAKAGRGDGTAVAAA